MVLVSEETLVPQSSTTARGRSSFRFLYTLAPWETSQNLLLNNSVGNIGMEKGWSESASYARTPSIVKVSIWRLGDIGGE